MPLQAVTVQRDVKSPVGDHVPFTGFNGWKFTTFHVEKTLDPRPAKRDEDRFFMLFSRHGGTEP